MLREACKCLCLPSTQGVNGLQAPEFPAASFRLPSPSLLEYGSLREAQRRFRVTVSVKQIAVSLQRMRKYPKLSLVGQWEVGMSPSVIDYFKAVFQWSMPRSPQDMQTRAVETFLLLQPFQSCRVWQKRNVRRSQGCKCAKRNNRCMVKSVVEACDGGTVKAGRWCGVVFCTKGCIC